MRRLLLLILATLATTANANETADAKPFSVLTNTTLSCSIKAPSLVVGCFWERPVATLFDAIELSIGIDAQAALRGGESYLAPMFTAAYYGPTTSIWMEVALPDGVLPVPAIGRGDWLRLGFSLRL